MYVEAMHWQKHILSATESGDVHSGNRNPLLPHASQPLLNDHEDQLF